MKVSLGQTVLELLDADKKQIYLTKADIQMDGWFREF